MIDWADIQEKLYTVVNQVTDLTVIWANQNAPQPDTPYITLNITSINKTGFDDLRYEDEKFNRCGLRKLNLSVQAYGNDALSALTTLKNSLETFTVEQALKEDTEIGIIESTDINNTTVLLDTVFEQRYSMDISFYIPENVDISDTSQIDSTKISGTLKESLTGTKEIETSISVGD